ncbi:MAG: AAA family ATPase, partial [Planctomycetota bacterium]
VQVLSHGMVKRLGVAQAFLGDPELILLDEPTSGLDPRNARQIRDLIAGLRVTSTIVISSHNLAELQDLCDRVAILDHGRVVASGTMDEVTGGGRTVEMRLSRALEAAEKEQLLGLEGVGSIQERGSASYTVTLLGPEIDPEQAVERLLRVLLDLQITPRSLEAGSSLEETFLELTERPAESEE